MMLQEEGVDAIELSGGTAVGVALNKLEIGFCPLGSHEPLWREAAEAYKSKVDIPLILVGGVRSLETAEALVEGAPPTTSPLGGR